MVENQPNMGSAGSPGLAAAHGRQQHRSLAAAELVADGSIELSAGTPTGIAGARQWLPFGTPVFVPVLPLHSMDSRVAIMRSLNEAGFDPVPHIAARRVGSRAQLRGFLEAAVEAGAVHRVLLIGGDSESVAGPYPDAAAVLRDEVLGGAGIREVGLAGYPEGHPRLPAEAMEAALLEKLELAAGQGLGAHVITQFSFVPTRIISWSTRLAGLAPEVPVYVGLAGPASVRQLVHYARYCGVAASLSAVGKVGVRLAQLASHAQADEQLALLASFNAAHDSSNIIGVHVFSFGGFLATARWMHAHLNAA